MATESYQVQLERVQAAIAKIEQSGQAYTLDNRSLTRADLGDLYDREKWLRKQAANAVRGSRVHHVAPR